MKKLTLMLAAVLGFAVLTMAQTDYTMYKVVYMKPDFTKLKELGKTIGDHNKKFHNEAPNAAHVWIVQTGPHTGDWLYVFGPTTFTDLDKLEHSDEHLQHWIGEVMPNVAEVSEGSYWRMNDELSFDGTIGFTGKEGIDLFQDQGF